MIIITIKEKVVKLKEERDEHRHMNMTYEMDCQTQNCKRTPSGGVICKERELERFSFFLFFLIIFLNCHSYGLCPLLPKSQIPTLLIASLSYTLLSLSFLFLFLFSFPQTYINHEIDRLQ